MNSTSTIPAHLPSGTLTNKSKFIREIASGSCAFAIPLTKGKEREEIGIIGSLDASMAYMNSLALEVSSILSLKELSLLEKFPENPILVSMAPKPNAPTAGFFFFTGNYAAGFKEFLSGFSYPIKKSSLSPFDTVTTLNADHPKIHDVGSRALRTSIELVSDISEDERVAIQKDRRFAALSRTHALQLRSALYPNNGQITQDVTASQINQRFGSISHDIENGEYFARVTLKDRWGNKNPRDLVIIPGYALEFLILNSNGTIKDYRDKQAINISLSMDVELDSDFKNATRFRINSPKAGQLEIVERAIRQLRKTQDKLSVFGQTRPIIEINRERRIHGIQGCLKWKDKLQISFTLHSNGEVSDVSIGNGERNSMTRLAITNPTRLKMIYRGRQYDLSQA